MNGFINLYKPQDMTSSSAVIKVRKILNVKKVGHLGTLDPLAEGVLPIAIGKGTKLFDLLLKKQKTYIARFLFGQETDTLDSTGIITAETEFNANSKDVERACLKFLGRISQVPPKFSAKSIDGVRAYKLARTGIEFDLKPKQVEIFSFNLIKQIARNEFEFEITCSSGTYIRSLARDLAYELNSLGHMTKLIRTKAGLFEIANAVTLIELEELQNTALLSIDFPIQDLEVFNVEKEYFRQLSNGAKIQCNFNENCYKKIYCDNIFFGVGRCVNGILDLQFYLR